MGRCEMPAAGDALNIEPNLRTLASLGSRKGAKLSYNPTTGRFSVQDAGFFQQSVARTFSGESVLDEARFRQPLLELFRAAADLPGDDIEDLFYDARKG